MARRESKIAKNVSTKYIVDYHDSEHERLVQFGSDRANPIEYVDGKMMVKIGTKYAEPKAFGLEVETGCKSINNSSVYAEIMDKVIFPHFPKDMWRVEHDGSLGGTANAECITQCMTKAFIRNQYPNFKVMWKYFEDMKIDPSAVWSGCGMHTNMSVGIFGKSKAAQDEAIKKFIYIINHHYMLMLTMVKRRWTERDGIAIARKDQCTYSYFRPMDRCDDVRFVKTSSCEDFQRTSQHGHCVNMKHYEKGRVEFRMVGGQGTYAEFRNTMETIFWLTSRVCTLSWKECDDVVAIFSGCNKYVLSRLGDARNENRLSSDAYEIIKEKCDRTEEFL